MKKQIYRIVFLGPQGSGKGTQAEMLAAELKIPIIATGDIYRQEAKKKTIFGEKVASYMHQGKLVPDDITNSLVERRLSKKDCEAGFILDGYPRTLAQAEALVSLADLTQVILIDISDKEAIHRIAGRVTCKCGATYHYKYKPPKKEGICDKCGEPLFVRKDDKEEMALRKRLAIYHEEIDPLIKFYSQKGILHKINGEPSIAKVHQEVMAVFN
jgi:adenylate kinase